MPLCPGPLVRWLICGPGPIAPRREPFLTLPPLRPSHPSSHLPTVTFLWQGSLPRPRPHLPTRLSSSSRDGPDGFIPPSGLLASRAGRPPPPRPAGARANAAWIELLSADHGEATQIHPIAASSTSLAVIFSAVWPGGMR